MANFLNAVSGFFSTALSAIKHLVMAPLYIVQMVTESMGTLTLAMSYLPTEVYIFATAVIAVSIMYLILGR